MKVSELIAVLQEYTPDATVCVTNRDLDCYPKAWVVKAHHIGLAKSETETVVLIDIMKR